MEARMVANWRAAEPANCAGHGVAEDAGIVFAVIEAQPHGGGVYGCSLELLPKWGNDQPHASYGRTSILRNGIQQIP